MTFAQEIDAGGSPYKRKADRVEIPQKKYSHCIYFFWALARVWNTYRSNESIIQNFAAVEGKILVATAEKEAKK